MARPMHRRRHWMEKIFVTALPWILMGIVAIIAAAEAGKERKKK